MFVALFYLAIAILLLAFGLIVYSRWNYGFLESLGIPVEPPTFLLGSCPNIYQTYPQYEDIKRFQKHGSVYGVYEGRSPQIMIADPELVKSILVRDYDHFRSRTPFDFGHNIPNEVLDYLPDDKWKAVRHMLTPQMTSSRLKQLTGLTLKVADEFTTDLLEECNGDRMKIDFRNRIVTILLDIVASGLYGIEVENRRDPNNSMVEMMKGILCERVKYDFRYTLIMSFPFLKHFFPNWPFPSEGLEPFRRVMRGYLNTRRQENKRHNGLGDVFEDMINLIDAPEFKKFDFTEETAVAQVVEVFFGSFDSTGTVLTMLVYYMSQNPEIQDKVLEEVDQVWDKYDGNLSDEAIGELTYLTACMNEAMRLGPPFLRPERKCTKEWVGCRDNGVQLRIPVNANVVVPIWALHRHPKYFPDPEKFDPERFMPENKKNLHPYAFAPFGHGPKNCIGMKLAYNNMKIIMCRLFKDFRFEMRNDSKFNFKPGTLFFIQFAPVYFDLVKRH